MTRPIEQARNADLRGSFPALLRAAKRARAVAVETRTALVIVRNDVVEHVYPDQEHGAMDVREPAPTYEK